MHLSRFLFFNVKEGKSGILESSIFFPKKFKQNTKVEQQHLGFWGHLHPQLSTASLSVPTARNIKELTADSPGHPCF